MENRRLLAVLVLVFVAFAALWLVFTAFREFPRGLDSALLVLLGLWLAWQAVRRVGGRRALFAAAALFAFVLALVGVLATLMILDLLFIGACVGVAYVLSARVFRLRSKLPQAPRPNHPVVVWNPKSGGGKALAAGLAQQARERGIDPIELAPGDDLEALVRQAIADGADALAAAGGDGTQAIVAGLAAEHDLPFACIPAGTRNHFALDLGVDRDDVVGALDAFVTGSERRVDLGSLNGRVFVNNVSMGLYAEAVSHQGYRSAKLRTILDTAPEVLSPEPSIRDFTWSGPSGQELSGAVVMLVSNNSYRLGVRLGAGTRPRMDAGVLGIAAMLGPSGEARLQRWRLPWRAWAVQSFRVDSKGPVPVGIDGESQTLEPPLEFTSRPKALRVRIAIAHPGVSPSAGLPEGFLDGLRRLINIAGGN